MKAVVLMAALLLTCGSAYADSCKVEAGSKKLAGAAMTSFMKKCETDATSACDKSAAEKKLSGAAKTSFTKKCVSDAVGKLITQHTLARALINDARAKLIACGVFQSGNGSGMTKM